MTTEAVHNDQVCVEEKRSRPWIGVRHMIICLGLLGEISAYTMRVVLSIAMVAMVDHSENPDFEEFEWDTFTQNIIFSAFEWSYTVALIPCALIVQTYGAKWPYIIGMAVTATATILTPVLASAGGWGAVCALRAIEGAAQGVCAPALQYVLSKWAPTSERATLSGIVFSGIPIASIIGFSSGGVLATSAGGWPCIFYVFGSLGLVCSTLWAVLATDRPQDHTLITEKEKDYIDCSLPRWNNVSARNTPWMSFFKSKPVWAIIFASCSYNWGSHILTAQLPTYLKTVLKYDIANSGFYSALPYLIMAIMKWTFGVTSDFSIKRKWIRVTTARKIFNTIACWGTGAAFAILGYVGKDQADIAEGILVIAVGASGGVSLGFILNLIDISPKYSSILMGIAMGIGNILAIVGPLVVGVVVTDEGSVSQWRIVFWICTAIYFTGNALYLLLGNTDRQSWDDPKAQEEPT